MVAPIRQQMTVDDFDRWVIAQSHDYEFIAGEAFQVVSNNYSSQIAMLIGAYMTLFVRQNTLGWVTGADGGYRVMDERYIPDVGFVSQLRQDAPNEDAYNPMAPDLAVEVVSPTDDPRKLLVKVSNYVAANTEVWVVYPDDEIVHVHLPGQAVHVFDKADTITSEQLPGFELAVAAIFQIA